MLHRLLLTALLCAAAFAAESERTPDVGDLAPEITDAEWVLNAPTGEFSLERYRGKVVLIQQWWFPCPACRSTFDWLEARYQEFHDQGLEVFAFEQMSTRGAGGASQATAEAIRALIAEKGGVSYPVSRGGTQDEYRGSFEFPYFWLLDGDGRVVFHEEAQAGFYHSTRAKLLELIPQLLANLRTPPLDVELSEELADAVKLYDHGRYGEAIESAEKATRRAEEGSPVLADVETLRKKVEERGAELLAQAEAKLEEGSFVQAFEDLEFIEHAFDGLESADTAKSRAKELKRDRTIKKELRAMEKLEKLLAKLGDADPEVRNALLDKFIKQNEGLKAAEQAAAAKR